MVAHLARVHRGRRDAMRNIDVGEIILFTRHGYYFALRGRGGGWGCAHAAAAICDTTHTHTRETHEYHFAYCMRPECALTMMMVELQPARGSILTLTSVRGWRWWACVTRCVLRKYNCTSGRAEQGATQTHIHNIYIL